MITKACVCVCVHIYIIVRGFKLRYWYLLGRYSTTLALFALVIFETGPHFLPGLA
jgi:hypothetical protein